MRTHGGQGFTKRSKITGGHKSRAPRHHGSPPAEEASVEAARSAGLTYVTDVKPGITRQRHGKGFRYLNADGRVVRNRRTLDRIRSLVIPPAWTNVWICAIQNGHLQATGVDARKRKQYRYHPSWRTVRDEAKYERMVAFAKALPRIRARVKRDLKLRGLPRDKVLASVVRLLETTLIRVGNEEYARTNDSFGLTTMKDKHVAVRGSKIRFEFRGKSGITHEIDVARTRRLAKNQVREVPGTSRAGTL